MKDAMLRYMLHYVLLLYNIHIELDRRAGSRTSD